MSEEPENLVLKVLVEIRADFARLDAKIDAQGADLHSEMHSLRADVASDLAAVEKRLSDRIVGMRRPVMEYHSFTIGHGVLITEIEERIRRLEQHLDLPFPGAH